MYLTVLIAAVIGVVGVGLIGGAELRSPYPATAKHLAVLSWAAALAGAFWWAASPGLGPLVLLVAGLGLVAAAFNQSDASDSGKRIPYQHPTI